jgi:integrase
VLRVKAPKTKHGRRSISLPPSVVEVLRGHRVTQLEQRLALGLGRIGAEHLVFPTPEGSPKRPDSLSWEWRGTVLGKGLPRVSFHALRHSHASALIAAGLDVMTVSRRLGHGIPEFARRTYGHLFADKADAATKAMDAAMTGMQDG